MEAIPLDILKFGGFLATFGVVGGLSYIALRSRAERVGIRSGLDQAIVGSPLVAEAREVQMQGPFGARVMAPAARRIAGLAYRFGPKGLRDKTRERLVLAGLADRLDVDAFWALSLATPIVTTAAVLVYRAYLGPPPLLGWIVIPASAFFPKMWLTGRVEARQHQIRLALPDCLDLLTIAVEAGLGFDAALARIASSVRGPLSDELYRMLQELRIGIPRSDALRSLSRRTQVLELDQFITAMTQADAFGISVGRVLRVQSHQLRQRRSQLAEEKANKTPVKLLFPLLLCIFPALFVVLVGPAALTIAKNFAGF